MSFAKNPSPWQCKSIRALVPSGSWRALASAMCLSALFALRCGDKGENGGPDPTPDPGCPGTQGELERLDFVFEELSWLDLSAEAGLAFATGTSIGFRVRPATDAESPPSSLRVSSGDPSILGATTDPDASFPHQLTFLGRGTASLSMLGDADEEWDRLAVRIEDPTAISLWLGPLLAEPLWLDAFAEGPDRALISPEGGARLAFALSNEQGDAMPGRWTPEIEQGSGSTLLAVPEGRLSVGEDTWVPIQLLALLAVAGGPGEDAITIRGPGGLERSLSVTLDATPLLDRLEVILPATSDHGEEVGLERVVTVMGRAPDGAPALGYPALFYSS
ncbi:MAG: hypothetical protein RBU30_11065, partial [Polyangia bacterium]|nr:hypothetical protein [Polyangia bacterium]